MVASRRSALLTLLGAALLALAAIVTGRSRRLDREIARRVEALRSSAGGHPHGRVTDDDLAELPDPVRRYLESVLEPGQPRIRTVRLAQRGELLMGDGPDDWKPFRAVQDVSVEPPGFLWDATVAVLPFLPARVVDAYEDGAGTLHARLLSTVPVAAVGSSPEVDEGELLRYLAEATWYPTALLGEGVSWEAIDDRSARATIQDRGTTASLEFRFDERGLVESVHAEARYRQEIDGHAPWTGYFGDYEERNGLVVPTAAEVAWGLPDGDVADDHQSYWRARVEAIDHEFAG